MSTDIVAVDIGGTHARFALATLDAGRVGELRDEITLKAAEHASLQTAWEAYAAALGRPLHRVPRGSRSPARSAGRCSS